MVKLVMKKRAGLPGEIGLFVNSPVWEDDFANIKMGVEVKVVATTPRSTRQLNYAWALATKVAEGCDWFTNKDDAMEEILIEAKHCYRIYDRLRCQAKLKAKPTNFEAMDGTEYTRLLKRMKHVIATVFIPHIDIPSLVAEIEAMISEPEPAAPASSSSERKAKGRRSALV